MARADAPPRRRRAVNGVLVLDKPAGMTSNAVLQRVRWLFRAEKAGHTGALDPLATGVLPLCFGEATKFSRYLLESDKAYRAGARLGVVTNTGDADGEVLAEHPVPPVCRDQLAALLAERFTGEVSQVPSMFSALKRDGKPLYELARQGIVVERDARVIRVDRLELLAVASDSFVIEAHVSKGTYIRSLVEDIGGALGCGAHVTALRRLQAGSFGIAQAHTLDAIEQVASAEGEAGLDRMLLPVDVTLDGWPVVTLSPESAYHTRRGQAATALSGAAELPEGASVALYEDTGSGSCLFLGVGEIGARGEVWPRRLLNTGAAT
jgi:tRNA pseudouridine55 synthase